MSADVDLTEAWRAAWPQALAAWSKYTRLRDARLCGSRIEAAQEGLTGSFAMIRLVDQSVVIDLESVRKLGLADYAVEILAHEIGHHVLAPASALDQFRLLARMRRALPTLEQSAPMVANLYTDLVINDRLQRQAGLRMADIYRALAAASAAPVSSPASASPPASASEPAPSRVWTLYMRIYENLWQLERGSLGGGEAPAALDTDAWLGARLIRVYGQDWMSGAGRFATLLLPYLVEDAGRAPIADLLLDTRHAADGCDPGAVHEIEADEIDGILHPVNDPLIADLDDADADAAPAGHAAASEQAGGQAREPFEYGEILKAAGITLTAHQIAMRYYRERAMPHLVPFPARPAPDHPEPQLEAVEAWQVGDPLDEIDWLESVMVSPRPVPGVTTVRRSYGSEAGRQRVNVPVDLDMYVDSSGSMPDPQTRISYPALAGAIIALSALRTGAAVQATLWSSKDQVLTTPGFVRDGDAVLAVLTGFFGGGTCFPVHRLRETFAAPRKRPAHILMISDDGISTMFDDDEKGNSGWAVAAAALKQGAAGGTMALNLPADWGRSRWMAETRAMLRRAQDEQGWDIHAIARFEDLIAFARAFSQRHYAGAAASLKRTPV